MNNFFVKKFEVNDFNHDNLREYDELCLKSLTVPLNHYIELLASNNCTYSGFYNNELVGVAGVHTLWEGVGEAFLLATPLFEKHPIFSARIIKNIFHDKIINEYSFDRIQTSVSIDFQKAIRFIEWLGFKKEGLMRKYINKVDYIRYVWPQ